jgi:type I restriction enzyme S subunit
MKQNRKREVVPKLRFPEFRDAGAWEKTPLSSILDYERPDKYIVSDTNYRSSGTPVLTANKSFVLGHTSETAGIFAATPVIIFDDFTTDKKYVDFPFKVKSSAIKILKNKGANSLKVIFELMRSLEFDPKEHKRYYISEYQNLEIALPKPPEQQKIADCLTALEEVIASQARKVEALKAHKKGLMQRLFPREGEAVPRLRFPEFRDEPEWKSRPFYDLLDDVLDFRGRTPKKLGMQWGDGSIISLSANNVKNGFIDYHAECYLGSEELYSRWMGDVNLEKDDIVFTMEAPLGNALLVPDSRKYILSQRVVAFKTTAEVTNRFLIQLIWGDGFQNAIGKLATGSAAKGVNQKALRSVSIRLPDKDEQVRIADFLSCLDKSIAAQTQKLHALNLHKQGLMQQLFPSAADVEA